MSIRRRAGLVAVLALLLLGASAGPAAAHALGTGTEASKPDPDILRAAMARTGRPKWATAPWNSPRSRRNSRERRGSRIAVA